MGLLLTLVCFGGLSSETEMLNTTQTFPLVRRIDVTAVPDPTALPSPQPIPSLTLSLQEFEALAALCVVEAMNMEETRPAACASILSTVFLRTAQEILSDGTILGTLRWNCKAGDVWCQFPAYVTYGCRGILPSRCPWNYPDQMDYFRDVVQSIIAGYVYPGGCYDYLFYDSIPGDDRACVIQSQRGHWIEFSN